MSEEPKVTLSSEDILRRNIKIKRLSFSSPSTKPIIESVKMFNQFYIFGAPPDQTYPLEPTLLAAFPSTSKSEIQADSFINQLKSFSFPSGLHKVTKFNKVLLQEFVFYLTTGVCEKTYGICVHFTAPPQNSPFFATRFNRNYPYCICFLSEVPFLSSHFQFASFIALCLSGVQKSLIKSKERKRVPLSVQGFCPKPLVLDHNFPSFAVFKGFSVPKTLYDLILHFYSLPSPQLPVPPQYTFSSSNENSDINIPQSYQQNKNSTEYSPIVLSTNLSLFIPYHLSHTQCLAYPTFHAFFSHLSSSSIVQIYTSILLEQNVLFVSKDLQLASFAVIAATSLIAPFVTQATVMPIIPHNSHFQDILQSPVPFVVGSTKSNENADVVVYLDDGLISHPDDLPKLPKHEELVRKLESLLIDSSDTILVPPKYNKSFFGSQTINPQYEKFMNSTNLCSFPTVFSNYSPLKYVMTPFLIEQILLLFAEFFPPTLTELLQSCFITDTTDLDNPITIVNKFLLKSIVPKDERDFYKSFSSTQIFADYSERKIDSFMKQNYKKEPCNGVVINSN